uniref:Uncharacterized protein n=1 Tax=Pristionchus pacificus TaxID=54126 RepID=A0A2A6C752_PRIPA|eukprot:PDM73947.1 hypothetical protein PRIPAC_41303 [Pristionchus pacificus]
MYLLEYLYSDRARARQHVHVVVAVDVAAAWQRSKTDEWSTSPFQTHRGMHTVMGTPICLPCQQSASAWLPADAANT